MIRRVEPEGETRWLYDAAHGGLNQVWGPNGYVETYRYDALGRLSRRETTVDGERFELRHSYDAAGQVATVRYPRTGLQVRYVYSATGYLEKVRDAASCDTVYWTAKARTARGQLAQVEFGNGVTTQHTYAAKTGWLQRIHTQTSAAAAVQDLHYAFDAFGNLQSRRDAARDVEEQFGYDALHRLTSAT